MVTEVTELEMEQLLRENMELRARLQEAEETLNAIRQGEVDAIVVSSTNGDKIYSLTSVETPYRILIEEMNEGALTVSDNGTILYCNQRFADQVATPLNKIIGSKFFRFVAQNNKASFNALFHEGLKQPCTGEVTCLDNENNLLFFHLSFNPLPPYIKNGCGIMVTDMTPLKHKDAELQQTHNRLEITNKILNVEIAERKQAELIIHNQNNELIKLNVDKDRFIAILAHDLRSPFNSILGFLNLLSLNLRNYQMTEIEEFVETINSTAKNTFKLLEDILLWIRANSGKIPFMPTQIDFTTLCNDVIKHYLPHANNKLIAIDYAPTDPITVFADKEMLETIMRNLVCNAIKFTHKNGQIHVYTQKDQDNVTINIADNGVGIAPEKSALLFDFTALYTTLGTAHEKGTGLGLPICKEFVERHGGRIWVESQPEKGTIFKFTLPLSKER